ncbi:MAG: nuclear transport factor 2 family protein [Actinomycetota bacterium]
MTPDRVLVDAKRTVADFHDALDRSSTTDLAEVVAKHTVDDYRWRGVDPLGDHRGADAAVEAFHLPLRTALSPLQRRTDVFCAGRNDVDGGASVWVLSMGHLMGLFDRPWLDIPPTGRMAFLRFAEFNRVEAGRVAETALFCDVIGMMAQAGQYPLPPPTGAHFVYPGPRTNDGLLVDQQDPAEGQATMDLVNRMVGDLSDLNDVANATGDDTCPPEVLARTWHDDMIWYGPTGIGATYTIDRYQAQHQYPFRLNLTAKGFNGHVARFAEGTYAGFFGWPNLTNTPTGGFLGLPGANTPADMRVVDVYRRDGVRLAENWVFIDLIHWLSLQGLDVLGRMRQLLGIESIVPAPEAS